ncbi:hypothetical protein PHJA_002555600 [Phtheirospermum japonicum]|uniref:Pectinesterase inhibitor domain-containing protein n=1 Tax=Phtheirospermum japonicum TaxID=374723 RepID=A0A830CY03_9LAMI|nr:hypothetical protein PHJA_002555600 [Phtheirospermum japonicum]
MVCRLFFLSAVLLGLSLSASAEQPLLRLKLRYGNKVSTLSGDPLIETACRGVGEFESECIATLQSAPSHQKADANGLSFFTLRFVMDHAVNLTVDIKKLKVSDLSPLLQSALNDCLDQYNPLDDLIEDAINAVLANSYADAQKFIDAAMTDINVCDSSLKASNMEEKLENKTGDDVQLAKNLKEYNVFLKNILSAASNILKAN